MIEYQHVCRSCGLSFVSGRKIHRTCSASCKGRVGGQGGLKMERIEKFLHQMPSGEADACWPWKFKRNWFGYGIFTFRSESTRAHRLAFEVFVGEIPQGFVVRHRCDNPSCVNPSHLQVGTHVDNMRDMVDRRRHANQVRTKCRRGHDLTPPEAMRETSRERLCAECARIRSREWAARKRKALMTAR